MLLELLQERIEREGRITFAEFMNLALYAPGEGYYVSLRDKVGKRRGDFYTSPEVHPVFGALLARQLGEMWLRLGCPNPFTVVEVGAGNGLLAQDILRASSDLGESFQQSLRYRIVEISPDLAQRQRELLAGWGDRVVWQGQILGDVPTENLTGCLLANEVIDAFPVHLVTTQQGELREIYVALSGDRFDEVIGDPSTPELAAYFDRLGLALPEACRAEVNLQALQWLSAAGRSLLRGYMVIIDYGYTAAEMYSAARPQGTLLCYHRHALHEDPYVLVGQQDLTAHVDFTSLMNRAQDEGLAVAGYTSQGDLLSNSGLNHYLSTLPQAGLSPTEVHRQRMLIHDLIEPEGLGRFRVLILGKRVPATPLLGLGGEALEAIPFASWTNLLQGDRLGQNADPQAGYLTGSWEDLLR